MIKGVCCTCQEIHRVVRLGGTFVMANHSAMGVISCIGEGMAPQALVGSVGSSCRINDERHDILNSIGPSWAEERAERNSR